MRKASLKISLKRRQEHTAERALKIFESIVPSLLDEAQELKEMYYKSALALPETLNDLGAIMLACSVLLEEIRKERQAIREKVTS